MKKTLLALALGLFALTSIAQKEFNKKRPHYPNQTKTYQRPTLTTELERLALDSVIFSDELTNALSEKIEFLYDERGNTDITYYYTYDYDKLEWVYSSKDNDFYDESGNDTLYLDYTWVDSTSSWILSSKTVWTYSESNLITKEIMTFYDSETLEINQINEIDLTYDDQDNILTSDKTTTIYSLGETYTFNHYEEFLNTYDENDNLISYYIVEDLDTTSGTVSEYDENNNLIKDYDYRQNTETNKLELVDSIIYSYDKNFFSGDYLIPWWTKFPNLNLLTEATMTNINEDGNEVFTLVFYYSTKDLTPIFKSINVSSTISIHPNPVKESFTIALEENKSIESIEIIDLNGTSVLRIYEPQEASVQISDLKSGIYFCRILSNGISYSEKIVVE